MANNEERYRIILSHKNLAMLPRNWRTFVGYLSAEQIVGAVLVVAFLKKFGIDVIVEHAPMEKLK